MDDDDVTLSTSLANLDSQTIALTYLDRAALRPPVCEHIAAHPSHFSLQANYDTRPHLKTIT